MSARDVAAGSSPVPSSIEEPDYFIRLALLAAIVESSDDAIVSKTLDGRILSWNAGASRIFGYTAEEVIGRPITIIIPPELHEEERRILEQVRGGQRIEHFDTIRIAKDGRRVFISLTVSPVRDSRGVIIGASKVARDVSERKRAEHAVLESERRLATQADALAKLNELSTRLWRSGSLNEGLDEILAAVIDLLGADKGNIQLLDAEGSKLSIVAQRGFEPDFLEFFGEVSATDDSPCSRALRSGQRILIENVETDGPDAPFRAVARAAGYRSMISTPLTRADGAPLGMVSSHFRLVHRPSEQELRRLDLYLRQASDFIQRCRLEQELQQSEEALRDADRRKDEFLALLAHELRNPLAPIRYTLAANRKTGRTPEQRKRAEEIIERQVTHMSRLLDDLLDVSRITRSTLELKMNPTELTLVVGSAIETARPILDTKHHSLSVELPKQAVRLEADAIRLAQVFSNLLINAAKYTDPGGHIQLRAAREGNEIVVAVRDDGIGISADMMPRLFEMFSQAQAALGRAEGGLGIGLSLVRGLVTLHGGSVEAHSDGPGRGSEFIVRLPARTPAEEPADIEVEADAPVAGAGMKILVVDDNRDAADACAALLELSGHHVQTAYTGRRALELAETFRPHVLLLDIGLPDLDGYQLAAKVRATPWGRGIALIAATGWGQEEDRRRAFDAGFDHHLTKPIAAETVESLLQSLRPLEPSSVRCKRSGLQEK
ncbi:MAG TPA: PAS domain S-box protein [Steroidobacteraceae bacterium]|nr:PAS domain S-box protein [Steroidobacteraceae bacterium]